MPLKINILLYKIIKLQINILYTKQYVEKIREIKVEFYCNCTIYMKSKGNQSLTIKAL